MCSLFSCFVFVWMDNYGILFVCVLQLTREEEVGRRRAASRRFVWSSNHGDVEHTLGCHFHNLLSCLILSHQDPRQ